MSSQKIYHSYPSDSFLVKDVQADCVFKDILANPAPINKFQHADAPALISIDFEVP